MAWVQNGNIYRKTSSNAIIDNIEKGVYYVKRDDYGFFLEKTNDFKLPSKIYGDTAIVNRWLTSYNHSDKNTGVLLSGLKGSGKTLLSKKLAIDSNLPIIILDTPYSGTEYVSFITSKDFTNVCFFIDEFDKIYDSTKNSGMTSLLSILDGTSNTHNLFIFTCNSIPNNYQYTFLINRPSRIKYKSKYTTLDINVINEVIDDLLENLEYKTDLLNICDAIGQLSFDTLISIIQEMNIFKENATECVSYMNITKENKLFDVEELWKGIWYPIATVSGNIYTDFTITRNFKAIKDCEYADIDYCEDKDYEGLEEHVIITPDMITKIGDDLWKVETGNETFRLRTAVIRKYVF